VAKKFPYQFFSISADILVFRYSGRWEALLIQRKNPPFQSSWALPGGFLDRREDALTAARRELNEETGLNCKELIEFGAFTAPDRDPRGRTATVAFYTFWKRSSGKAVASDDAKNVQWFPISRLPSLAFDHKEIISRGIKAARAKMKSTQKFLY
jgi:8-oxo-dGTP diphosphatase